MDTRKEEQETVHADSVPGKSAREIIHLEHLEPCPFLPMVEVPLPAAAMREVRDDHYGVHFYQQALRCGQSLWLQGLPAQSLLMLNRALGADLQGGEPVLDSWPLPYTAAAWVMKQRTEDQFIGNPRRHYQHLATRMVEPRKAQRTARAWACWLLACRIYPDYPADEKQIAEEGISEPDRQKVLAMLEKEGVRGEVDVFCQAEEFANRD